MKKLLKGKSLIFASLLLLGACKGPKGDKGDTGVQGLRGPGNIEYVTGPVTSDDFIVTNSVFFSANQISVYLLASGNAVQTTNWRFTPGLDKLELFGALTQGAATYLIVVII